MSWSSRLDLYHSLAASSKYTQNLLPPPRPKPPPLLPWMAMMASPGSLCLSLCLLARQSDPGKYVGSSLSSAQNFPGHPLSPVLRCGPCSLFLLWRRLVLLSRAPWLAFVRSLDHPRRLWRYAFTSVLSTQHVPAAFQALTEPSPRCEACPDRPV